MRPRTWMDLQVTTLAAGTLFAWSVVATDLYWFTLTGGDLTQFRGTALPNPLTTTCFYAAVGFAVALRWGVRLQRTGDATGQRHLAWLLAAGTLVALGNVGYGCYALAVHGGAGHTCTVAAMINPLDSPCFVGFLLYLGAMLGTLAVARALRLRSRPSAPRRPRLRLHNRVA